MTEEERVAHRLMGSAPLVIKDPLREGVVLSCYCPFCGGVMVFYYASVSYPITDKQVNSLVGSRWTCIPCHKEVKVLPPTTGTIDE